MNNILKETISLIMRQNRGYIEYKNYIISSNNFQNVKSTLYFIFNKWKKYGKKDNWFNQSIYDYSKYE